MYDISQTLFCVAVVNTSGQGCSYLAASLLCMCERGIFELLAWKHRGATEVEKKEASTQSH